MERQIKNLTDENAHMITNRFNELLMHILKLKKITSTRRLEFDKLHIIYPGMKTYILDIKYLKNAKKILSYFFANIEKKPFIDRRYNIYAFKILWILLVILDMIHGYSNSSANTIKFGKYVFTIPKYKQFIFDVKGFNLAKLIVM